MMRQINSRSGRTLLLLAVACGLIALPTFSQTPGTARPAFEVAAIKPYADPGPGPRFFGFRSLPGGRLDMTGVTFKMLMTFAYDARDFQIIGGPDWINSERYDIQAKAEEGSVPPQTGPRDPNVPDPLAVRTQSLLDDRFQLKMHRETRDLPIYELVPVKGGAKLALAEDQSVPQPPKPGDPLPPPPQRGGPPGRGGLFMQRSLEGFTLQATGVPLSNLIAAISQQVGRPVVDKSQLKPGLYDFKLQWTDSGPTGGALGPGGPLGPGGAAPPPPPSPTADSAGPSIFTAIQEQLGLRLNPTKGPQEVFVIDGVQKPSDN